MRSYRPIQSSIVETASPATTSVTQTTVAIGPVPAYAKTATITDAAVNAGSKIVASIMHSTDDIALSSAMCAVGIPSVGSFPLTVYAANGPISGTFTINYIVG